MVKTRINLSIDLDVWENFKEKIGNGGYSAAVQEFMEGYKIKDIKELNKNILLKELEELKENTKKKQAELIQKQDQLQRILNKEAAEETLKLEQEKQLLENAKRCFRCSEVIENIETLKDFKDFKLCNSCFLGLKGSEISELRKRAKEEQLNEGKDDNKKIKKI